MFFVLVCYLCIGLSICRLCHNNQTRLETPVYEVLGVRVGGSYSVQGVGILMSVEFYRESPGKFDSRTLNRKTLNKWPGRKCLGWGSGVPTPSVSFGGHPAILYHIIGCLFIVHRIISLHGTHYHISFEAFTMYLCCWYYYYYHHYYHHYYHYYHYH